MTTSTRNRPGARRRVARLRRALLLGCLLVGPASAQDAGYRLAAGDRVALSVYGQAELSGEFPVGSGGGVVLPLVGEIAVAALTLPEAQARIAERLADGYLQQPVVSLRVAEMRPIYVLGDVRLPGSYPFRPGLSVLSGIALAGGFPLPETVQITQRTDFLLADERLRVLETNFRLYGVRRARLEAQRLDQETFAPPRGDADEAEAFVAQERMILATQRDALRQSVALLEAQKPRIETEIAGVKAQREAEETQLRLIQAHLEDYEKLISNGLARRYQGIELQREEARNKGSIARLNADLARLDLALGDLALRVQEMKDTYHRRVMAELQEAAMRLEETRTQLPSAREIREARLQSGSALAGGVSAPRTIRVTRTSEGGTETIETDMRAALMPGDIVEVRRGGPELAAAAGPDGARLRETAALR